MKLGDGRELLRRLLADPPDFVFNFAEGQGIGRSREARVPAVLEMLGIPYTGSDPLTLAVTLDKDCAKRLVASAGVAVPRWRASLQPERRPATDRRLGTGCRYPSSSSRPGKARARASAASAWSTTADELLDAVDGLRRDHRQPILVEEFIHGDELTVGIVGNDPPRILGVMRVVPRQPTDRFVYSLEVKRDWRRQVRYECPPRLPADDVEAVEQAALTAYRVLGCRDVARIDFRLRDGVPYFLEVNPLPGLNPGVERPGHPGTAGRLDLRATDRRHPPGGPGPPRRQVRAPPPPDACPDEAERSRRSEACSRDDRTA